MVGLNVSQIEKIEKATREFVIVMVNQSLDNLVAQHVKHNPQTRKCVCIDISGDSFLDPSLLPINTIFSMGLKETHKLSQKYIDQIIAYDSAKGRGINVIYKEIHLNQSTNGIDMKQSTLNYYYYPPNNKKEFTTTTLIEECLQQASQITSPSPLILLLDQKLITENHDLEKVIEFANNKMPMPPIVFITGPKTLASEYANTLKSKTTLWSFTPFLQYALKVYTARESVLASGSPTDLFILTNHLEQLWLHYLSSSVVPFTPKVSACNPPFSNTDVLFIYADDDIDILLRQAVPEYDEWRMSDTGMSGGEFSPTANVTHYHPLVARHWFVATSLAYASLATEIGSLANQFTTIAIYPLKNKRFDKTQREYNTKSILQIVETIERAYKRNQQAKKQQNSSILEKTKKTFNDWITPQPETYTAAVFNPQKDSPTLKKDSPTLKKILLVDFNPDSIQNQWEEISDHQPQYIDKTLSLTRAVLESVHSISDTFAEGALLQKKDNT